MTNRTTNKSRPEKTLSVPDHEIQLAADLERDLLIALFRMSRDTLHITAKTLADELAGTPTQIGAALVALEQAGIVDATRARLTMKGLVLAAQLGASSGGPRIAHRKSQPKAKAAPRALEEESVPVAALPSQPPRAPASLPRYERQQEATIGLHS